MRLYQGSTFTGNQEIPIAKSIVHYIFRWLGARFLPKDERDALGILDRSAPATAAGSPAVSLGGGTLVDAISDQGSSAVPGTPDAEEVERTNEAVGEAPVTTVPAEDVRPVAVAAQPTSQREPEPVMMSAIKNGNGHTNGGGAEVTATATLSPIALGNLGATRVGFSVSADSPSCAECGSIMVRNGSCYKCLNCGSTSGCS